MSEGRLLAIDTATHRATLALGEADGSPVAGHAWEAQQRHGETLLEAIDALLREAGTPLAALGGLIVGTGPGSFTGLRVGLATAKTLAYTLACPLVGVPTARALGRAVVDVDGADRRDARTLVVVMRAGSSDRYLTRLVAAPHGGTLQLDGAPSLVPRGAPLAALVADAELIALELTSEEGIAETALASGRRALARLGGALLALGSEALAEGLVDDPATLVPLYVTLPRGVAPNEAVVAWSPDPR